LEIVFISFPRSTLVPDRNLLELDRLRPAQRWLVMCLLRLNTSPARLLLIMLCVVG
jgi:hypothetical protein